MLRVDPKLSLGTATFGFDYGISNDNGKLSPLEVKEILRQAADHDISHLDTASAYGEAEKLIGEYWPGTLPVNITTKIALQDCHTASAMIDTVKRSLDATKATRFWSVLLHDPLALSGANGRQVRDGLIQVLETGLATKIGVSAYSEEEIVRSKDLMPELTIFQIPENVCDQRKFSSTNLLEMSQRGDEFFIRSIFLQGLLLMNPKELPSKVGTAAQVLEEVSEFCRERSISLFELCVGYSKSIPWASGVVVGIASVEQSMKLMREFHTIKSGEYADVPLFDNWLVDPRNWS